MKNLIFPLIGSAVHVGL